MRDSEGLRRRFQALGVTPDELGLEAMLRLVEDAERRGQPNAHLHQILDTRLALAEQAHRTSPFLEPSRDAGLDVGDVHVLSTPGGQLLGFSFGPGRPNSMGHVALLGPTGAGKSVLLCLLLAQAARAGLHVLLLATNPSVLGVDALNGFVVINAADAGFNPYHAPRGVDVRVWDTHVTQTFARQLELQWGELEIGEAVEALRDRSVVPTIPRILQELQARQRGSWSRRHQYRDSAILTLRGLHTATSGAFSTEGIDPRVFFTSRVILLLPYAPRYASIISQTLLVVAWLLGTQRERFSTHVVFGVDEAQALGTDRDAPGLLLGLRHAGVSWVGCAQNAQALPPLVLGNMDLLVSFRATDARDRTVICGAMSLTRDQADALGVLGPREVIAFSPRWGWKRAVKALVPAVAVHRVDDRVVAERTRPWRDAARRAADEHARREAERAAAAGGVGDDHAGSPGARAEGTRSGRGEDGARAGRPGRDKPGGREDGPGAKTAGSRTGQPGEQARGDPGRTTRGQAAGGAAGRSRPEGEVGAAAGADPGEGAVAQGAFRFLVDVTTRAHEFTPLTSRWERAGIRSAAAQQRILKACQADGLVRVWELSVGQGRPWKLVEATPKAFERVGVVAWPKGRGSLPTRAATQLLHDTLARRAGWSVVREGVVAGKQVDLVVRDDQGRLVTVEVAGSDKHEIANALHCLAVPEVRKHVVVCVSVRVVDGVRRKFAGFDGLKAGERLEVVALAAALKEDWQP